MDQSIGAPLYIGIAYVLPQVHPTSTDILSFLRDIGQAMSFFHIRYGSFQLLHLSELLRERKKNIQLLQYYFD